MTLAVDIAGSAWRTPLGAACDTAMARLWAGERAATTDPRRGYRCTVVAPIPDQPRRSRQDRFLRRMGLFGLEVATEALGASGIGAGARVGLFAGVGGLRAHWDDMLGAFAGQDADGARMWERGLKDVHPYWMLRHLSNNVHALAAAELGVRGEGATFGGGTAGAQALSAAARALHDGVVDAALVVAYDSLLEPETLVELAEHGTATTATLRDLVPPYASAACGSVPGEAAAAVVVVRPTDGSRRARLSVRDAAGAGALTSCVVAVARPDVGVVDGAGRAWPELDQRERELAAKALRDAGRRDADDQVALTTISAAMGQLGAATAVVQAIALGEMLRAGRVAPIAGLADGSARVSPLVPVTSARATTSLVALGLHVAAPELASAITVEVTRS